MYKSLILVGLILIALGAIVVSNVYIPGVSRHIDSAFAYIPLDTLYSSIIFIVVGFVVLVFGIDISQMGRYFKFY